MCTNVQKVILFFNFRWMKYKIHPEWDFARLFKAIRSMHEYMSCCCGYKPRPSLLLSTQYTLTQSCLCSNFVDFVVVVIAVFNTYVLVVEVLTKGPYIFLCQHIFTRGVCPARTLELTLRDHTEHRNGNICFLFTWAAENGCFLCTWAPAAFDKADTWVSWTIQLQNHYIIIAEKYDLRVNAKSIPYYAM